MNELIKQASVDNVKFKKPTNPCDTRWNAQFDSMVSILALKVRKMMPGLLKLLIEASGSF